MSFQGFSSTWNGGVILESGIHPIPKLVKRCRTLFVSAGTFESAWKTAHVSIPVLCKRIHDSK